MLRAWSDGRSVRRHHSAVSVSDLTACVVEHPTKKNSVLALGLLPARGSTSLRGLRILLCFTLAAVTSGLASATYLISRNAEESDFTSHAQGVASSVVFSFVSGLNRTRAAGETLAGAFSSPAPSGRPWPNVSLPTFLAAASPLLLAADSRRVAFEPVFAPSLLPGWLSFAATAAQPGVPVAGGLTHIGASSLVPYNATGDSLVVPIFQVAPASLASQALFDQYSEPRRVAAINQALARNASVVTDFVVLLSELSSPKPQPSGLLFSPLTDGGSIVAFIMVGFSWSDFLADTLPSDVPPLDAVLVSSASGEAWTFNLGGRGVTGFSAGDSHDSEYTSLGLSARRGAAERQLEAPSYLTNRPAVYCGGVVAVVAFLTLVGAAYDARVRRVAALAHGAAASASKLAEERDAAVVAALRDSLSRARSEAAILGCVSAAVAALFPGCAFAAAGSFDDAWAPTPALTSVAPAVASSPLARALAAAAAHATSFGASSRASPLSSACELVSHRSNPSQRDQASHRSNPSQRSNPSHRDSSASLDACLNARLDEEAPSPPPPPPPSPPYNHGGASTTPRLFSPRGAVCALAAAAAAAAEEGASPPRALLTPQLESQLGPAAGGAPCTVAAITSFDDWKHASAAGLAGGAVVAPVCAGYRAVGFVCVLFGATLAPPPHGRCGAFLRELCDVAGGALACQYSEEVTREAVDEGLAATGVAEGVHLMPSRRQTSARGSLNAASDKTAGSCDGAAAAAAAAPSGARARSSVATQSDAEIGASLAASSARDAVVLRATGPGSLDADEVPTHELRRLVLAMFASFGLCARFGVGYATLASFVAAVESRYAANPFHNFRHAFNVTKAAWYIVDAGGFLPNCLLTDLDVFTLLLSALCHDLEHKGTTNAFETMTCSEHALRYNDVSVLENHHASVGFQLVDASNLLTLLDQSEFLAFRRQFLRAILSTDMSVHKTLLSTVNEKVESRQGAFVNAPLDDRILLVSFVLHCADLCNPLFPPAVSQRIAAALSSEFDAQAERERALGLPVTVVQASCDSAKAKMELGFLRFVVYPLYKTLLTIVPKLLPITALIDANIAAWESHVARDASTGSAASRSSSRRSSRGVGGGTRTSTRIRESASATAASHASSCL